MAVAIMSTRDDIPVFMSVDFTKVFILNIHGFHMTYLFCPSLSDKNYSLFRYSVILLTLGYARASMRIYKHFGPVFCEYGR